MSSAAAEDPAGAPASAFFYFAFFRKVLYSDFSEKLPTILSVRIN